MTTRDSAIKSAKEIIVTQLLPFLLRRKILIRDLPVISTMHWALNKPKKPSLLSKTPRESYHNKKKRLATSASRPIPNLARLKLQRLLQPGILCRHRLWMVLRIKTKRHRSLSKKWRFLTKKMKIGLMLKSSHLRNKDLPRLVKRKKRTTWAQSHKSGTKRLLPFQMRYREPAMKSNMIKLPWDLVSSSKLKTSFRQTRMVTSKIWTATQPVHIHSTPIQTMVKVTPFRMSPLKVITNLMCHMSCTGNAFMLIQPCSMQALKEVLLVLIETLKQSWTAATPTAHKMPRALWPWWATSMPLLILTIACRPVNEKV